MAAKPVKVSQLNAYIKRILQSSPVLSNVTVIGEVSNLKFHSSGHVYFSLKDEKGKISCFLPADIAVSMDKSIEEGTEAVVTGYIYLYERGGSYSINVKTIEKSGTGNLAAEFEKLKKKLEAEGLFDRSAKKPLNPFPRRVAVVTSDTGAAVHDIIKIIRSRNRYVDILVCPVLVQGPSAASDISSMISELNEKCPDTDVIITGRGGGSMEELWAFNEESVARAIAASDIPVISAVGHETDFTIADFAADVRAETPTAAAVLAVPDINELVMYTDELMQSIDAYMDSILERNYLRLQGSGIVQMSHLLYSMISGREMEIKALFNVLEFETDSRLERLDSRIKLCRDTIENLNPSRILEKGYSIIKDENDLCITEIGDLRSGNEIKIVMRGGDAGALITEVRKYNGKQGNVI
ncbi:MAG: exodeoxyribonuclease VII large subunit [Anaerovoracaceae bacterium]|nr:exodeoxyribonuclease VII large subunit [Anaerovoracaceae bacterium]